MDLHGERLSGWCRQETTGSLEYEGGFVRRAASQADEVIRLQRKANVSEEDLGRRGFGEKRIWGEEDLGRSDAADGGRLARH